MSQGAAAQAFRQATAAPGSEQGKQVLAAGHLIPLTRYRGVLPLVARGPDSLGVPDRGA